MGGRDQGDIRDRAGALPRGEVPAPPDLSPPPAANEDASQLLSPGRLAVQVVGFLAGLGLLAWIIVRAAQAGDWRRVLDAGPGWAVVLLSCSLVSAIANGTMFWVTIRPVHPIAFRDIQRINFAANMFNYAPVRLGVLLRVLYHMRVDGLTLLQIGAWFSFIGYTLAVGVGACIVAWVIRPTIDATWVVIVLAQLILGGLAARMTGGLPLLERYGQGIDRMTANPPALWGAICLRMVDLAAFTGRIAAAAVILSFDIPAAHLVVLALVAHAASLIPLGRFGFREFCVAVVAERLSALGGDPESNMAQLALVESAGEVLVYIPLGLASLPWVRRRWKAARRSDEATKGRTGEGAKGNETPVP